MLFSYEGMSTCVLLDGFLIAPLPAKKQLWEARDENDWFKHKRLAVDFDSIYGIKVGGRMAKLGKFIDVQETQMELLMVRPKEPTESESSENWNEWCSGMDELGGLIMLAASLPTEV
jgi:hypothetical protein